MEKMTYTEAVEYIHSIPKFSRILGNDVLRELLARLGNPHKKLRYIHIAGTNGKGSTASMTAKILECEGYKVGLYTSPFLEVFNERIRINGENIPDDVLAELVGEVKEQTVQMGKSPSEFAFTTAVMFLYFCRERCDWVVLETGMGGKLDATNVIENTAVTVLTSISLDHTQYLGDTIEKIALEKCGIIKSGTCAVCCPRQDKAALDTIKKVCAEKNVGLCIADDPELCTDGFSYKGKRYKLSLRGTYQPYNAATVLCVIDAMRKIGVKISDKSVSDGLANASWAGRFEYIMPNMVIDGGHNPSGVYELRKSLAATGKRIILVMAMMEDKDYEKCIELIAPSAYKIYATQIDYPRCLRAERLAQSAQKLCTEVLTVSDAPTAVCEALAKAEKDDLVCVCGSLFLAGLIRKRFSDGLL